MKNTLSKAERLSSKKWIEELYSTGLSFRVYPIKITFLQHTFPTAMPVMMLVSAPKHLFKHAHDRNLLKRRMRESYRLHKHDFLERISQHKFRYFISFQYTGKTIEPYSSVEKSMIKALNKLGSEIGMPQEL